MTEVLVSSGEGLRQEIWAGRHSLIADEPASAGGADAGPNPYELLLAALGSCTSMTLLLYARRKEWALENIEIRLTFDRVHAQDCSDCEQTEGYVERIEKDIVVHGSLTPEQLERLGEIAEKCPVHKTLRQGLHTRQTIRCAGQPTAG